MSTRKKLDEMCRRIDEAYRLISEKHEMIVDDRRKIDAAYRLISEKHEMIVDDRKKIDEAYSLISEKHEMIVDERKKIEEMCGKLDELYSLISEKHEMIMGIRHDVTSLNKFAILSYWDGRRQTEEEREVIDWIREHGVSMYPYSWADEYKNKGTIVMTEGGWRFVEHQGKRLYFPKSFDEKKVRQYYNFLIMEQDKRSPHCYLPDGYTMEDNEYIWLDVGAAEGILLLEHIHEIRHGYAIENDAMWVEALRKTFQPYGDKVTIIDKMADSYTDESHIAISDILDTEEKYFIKIDVEGHEQNVLDGIEWDGLKNGSRLAVCAYHHQEDEEKLGAYLKEKGIDFVMSDGYLLSEWGGEEEPYLRRGLFRAVKRGDMDGTSDNI